MPNISLNLGLKHRKDNNMRYIDAEKLKANIESISLIPQTSADYNDGRDDMKIMVLDIIDSLQQERPDDVVVVAKAFLDALSKTPYNNKPITDAQIIVKQLLLFFENPKEYNPDAILEQPEVDLEKELNDYGYHYDYVSLADRKELVKLAKHFFELGLQTHTTVIYKPTETDVYKLGLKARKEE